MLNYLFSVEEHLLITFIASFLIVFMVGGVIYFWIIRKKIPFRQVAIALLAMTFAWAISDILKRIFVTERPFMVNGQDPLTFTWPLDSSFPSNHASSAFALALSLRKSDKRLFLLYFIFAFVVSFGRVLSRVHYFFDVFVGALIGISAVLILERIGIEKFLKRIFD